jgi:RNA polymerase sigma factor (sigma-70 family)
MNSQTDNELLRDYSEDGSEAAFAELVRRHVDFVFSAALRLVRDAHLAQDVSQKVFLALAHHAGQLLDHAFLSGWLHRTTHNLSANTVRADVRRRIREQEAATMNEVFAAQSESAWQAVAPHLDAVLNELSEPDRNALLLRYFERKSSRQMAETLGISGEAAQKRVNRAVDRLRELFSKRGITVGANGLIMLITANAVQPAPAGLAATIYTAVIAGASLHASTVVATTKIITMTTLQKTIIASILATVVGTGIFEARQAVHRRDQTLALQQLQVAVQPQPLSPDPAPAANTSVIGSLQPRLAAPRGPSRPATNLSSGVPFRETQFYALLTNKVPKLTLAQVEPYLQANGRSAASLLAGFRTTANPTLLAEAMEKYPKDPQVAFAAAIRLDAPAAERRQWLDALKESAPDNLLANYLSALDHLKAGQVEQGVQDLADSSRKAQFEDYAKESIQTDEKAYLAAGYPPGEAGMLANTFLAEPQLVAVKELGGKLIELAASYQATGDESSRVAALQMAADMGRRLSDPSAGETLLRQMLGISVERAALSALDPAGAYGTAGQTVQQRLNALIEQKQTIQALAKQADPLWQTLSDQDWVDYHSQLAAAGEEAAVRWLVSNRGQR